jgi:hypothetical protein
VALRVVIVLQARRPFNWGSISASGPTWAPLVRLSVSLSLSVLEDNSAGSSSRILASM